jgi:hypothetical protein
MRLVHRTGRNAGSFGLVSRRVVVLSAVAVLAEHFAAGGALGVGVET